MTSPVRGNTPTFKTEPRAMNCPTRISPLAQFGAPANFLRGPASARDRAGNRRRAAGVCHRAASTNIAGDAFPNPNPHEYPVSTTPSSPGHGRRQEGYQRFSEVRISGHRHWRQAGQPYWPRCRSSRLRGSGPARLRQASSSSTTTPTFRLRAHNREILVKKGSSQQGTEDREMGDTDADQVSFISIRRSASPSTRRNSFHPHEPAATTTPASHEGSVDDP